MKISQSGLFPSALATKFFVNISHLSYAYL